MNGIVNGLQGFLKNKNIVTILGVIAILGILYFTYNNQIEKQVRPYRNIPVAREAIQPGTMITDEMIDYVDISPIVFNHGRVARFSNEVVGKYADYNTVIPAGSLFYLDVLISEEQLPDSVFTKVKDGDVVTRFAVTTETTYGNSIFPGNRIDIYMKVIVPSTRTIMVGKLLENITIIAVKDNSGKDVFVRREDESQSAMLIFGLDPILHNLLLKASYMRDFEVELIPVPHGGTVENTGGTQIKSEALKLLIEANSEPNEELFSDQDIVVDDLIIEDENIDLEDLIDGVE